MVQPDPPAPELCPGCRCADLEPDADRCSHCGHVLLRIGGEGSAQRVVEYFIKLLADFGFGDDGCLHPDYEEARPQTGELIRGRDNWRTNTLGYPGIPRGESWEPVSMIAEPVIHVSGDGNSFTSEQTVYYTGEDQYQLVVIGELKDGLVYRSRIYWAVPEEAPEWRAQLVVPMEGD
jgi:hypothetical protein